MSNFEDVFEISDFSTPTPIEKYVKHNWSFTKKDFVQAWKNWIIHFNNKQKKKLVLQKKLHLKKKFIKYNIIILILILLMINLQKV